MRFKLPLYILFTFTIAITACKKDNNNCEGTVYASWKVNGEHEDSYVWSFNRAGAFLNYTFEACNEHDINYVGLSYIPYPPVIGTYEIKAGVSNLPATVQGFYSFEDSEDYSTNNSNTGSVSITSVNGVNKTMSGTFQFEALQNGAGSNIKQITEGIFTDVKYE